MSVRNPEQLSYALFDHETITGEKVAQKVIAAADETANYSSEFSFDEFFQNTLGIIGLAMELDGNASDTITVVVEFYYGKGMTWGTKTITLLNAVAANTNQYVRIDIQSGWRDYLPFNKIRFKITKTGTNGTCTIKSRIQRV